MQNPNKIPLLCSLDLHRYLGLWYEIGKLPARGQMGLTHVTATYRLGKDGKIIVENKGYKNGKKRGISGKSLAKRQKVHRRPLCAVLLAFQRRL